MRETGDTSVIFFNSNGRQKGMHLATSGRPEASWKGMPLTSDQRPMVNRWGGVKERSFFTRVKMSNFMFSVLRAMMGLGNNGVSYLCDCMEHHLENIPQEEVGLSSAVLVLTQCLAETRTIRHTWEKGTAEDREWNRLTGRINYQKRQLELGRGAFFNDMKIWNELIGRLRLAVLNECKALFVESVDDAVAELAKVMEEIKDQ